MSDVERLAARIRPYVSFSAGEFHTSKCHKCATKFEWHTDEAIMRPDLRDGSYYEVECPVCGGSVTKAIDYRHYA